MKAGEFKTCGGCQSVFYCTPDHQKGDWKSHKNLCKAISTLKAAKTGYTKTIKTEGNSKLKPKKGEILHIHFTGKLPSGVVFEDSRVIKQPLEIKIGKKNLIRGLDDGIPTMNLGERAEFLISSEWAYGDKTWQSNAPPRIPTHLPLLFDVTLLRVGNKDSDEWLAIQAEKTQKAAAAAATAAAEPAAAAPQSAAAAAAAPTALTTSSNTPAVTAAVAASGPAPAATATASASK